MDKIREIRDHRNRGWLWIGYRVIDEFGAKIGAQGIAVYAVLARHADNQSQSSFPAVPTIAAKVGISERQVRYVLAQLAEQGLIVITEQFDASGRQTTNSYALLDPPEIRPSVGGGAGGAGTGVQVVQGVGAGGAAPTIEQDSINKTQRERDAPPLPTVETFTIDELRDPLLWARRAAAKAGVPAAIDYYTETEAWRDQIRSGARPVPADVEADWRMWIRRAIHWAKTHPQTQGATNGTNGVDRGGDRPPAPADDAAAHARAADKLREFFGSLPAPGLPAG